MKQNLWSVLQTRMSCPHVSTLASFYSLPHWKGQAEEEPICHIYNNLWGQKRSSALLGLHAQTGSDMSGRFAGRTKDWCFQAFMSYDDEILDALAMLGNDNDLPSDACSQLERFVLYAIAIKNPHNSKRASLVPLLKSCSRRRKPPTNFWFTARTYSYIYLHTTQPWFGGKLTKVTHASQDLLHLVGHLTHVQVTSILFHVWIHQLLTQYCTW